MPEEEIGTLGCTVYISLIEEKERTYWECIRILHCIVMMRFEKDFLEESKVKRLNSAFCIK